MREMDRRDQEGRCQARHVRFYTATGRAQVKRVVGTLATRLLRREAEGGRAAPPYGEVTLFQ